MKENLLGREKISKLFIMYSIPAIIAMVIAGMQTIVDGLFVGNFVGENAMASVNIAQPFVQLSIALSMMISVGSLSYMGRTLGEGNKEKTQNIFRTSVVILIIIAIILSFSGIVFNKEIAYLLGANDALVANSADYIRTISIFLIPMFLGFQFGFANRLIEKPDLYFKGMILSLFINITMNYITIAKLGFGVKGAALATGLCNTSVLLIVIWPLINRKNVINIFVGSFDKTTIAPVLYNGASEGLSSIAAAISGYIFNRTFMNTAGSAGVVAYTTINYISIFASYIMFGIGDGIGPIVSYNFGANKKDRVKKIMLISYVVALIIGIVLFCILFFYGENLIRLFGSNNDEVRSLAILGSKICSIAFLINGFNIVNSAYFTAIGKAKESVVIAISRGLIFIVVGITFLPAILGNRGIWLSIVFAECCTMGICIYYLAREKSYFEDYIMV